MKMKDPLTISASASQDSSASETILTVKASSGGSAQVWALPKDEHESRQEPQRSSSVEGCDRQGIEEKTSEHVQDVAAMATSPRVDESIEHTYDQFVDEKRSLDAGSEEVVVMDELATIIFKSGKQSPNHIVSKESVEKDQNQLMEQRPTHQSETPKDEPVTEKQVAKTDGWISSRFSCNPTCCATVDAGAFNDINMEKINEEVSADESPSQEPMQQPISKSRSCEDISQPTTMMPEEEQTGGKSVADMNEEPEKERDSKEGQEETAKLEEEPEQEKDNKEGKEEAAKLRKKKKKFGVLKKLSKKFSGKMMSKKHVSKEVVTEPGVLGVIMEDPMVEEVASVEAPEKVSSSLLDKDAEDEIDVETEQLNEEEPCANDKTSINEETSSKRKPLSLANILSLGACSVNADNTSDFIDRIESDGYEGGSEKTSEDEAPPKSLFSCGIVSTSHRGGVFEGLTSVQSDAAVGITTDMDDDEMKAITKEINISSFGDENISNMGTNESIKDYQEIKAKKSSPSEELNQRDPTNPDPDIKMKKTKSKEDNPRSRASPVHLVKKSSSVEDTAQRRRAPDASVQKEIKLKSDSSEGKSQSSPAREKAKPNKRALSMKKEKNKAELATQESSEKSHSKSGATELDEMLEITKTSSSGLLAALSSVTDDDTFIGHMEAKFDLYNQKFDLIQKFGKLLDQLKKKQALVKAKEMEIEEAQEAIEVATKVSVLKRKKKELAILQRELEKLKKKEEEAKVPVARLHELLNTQLDKEIGKSIEEDISLLDARKFLLRVPGMAACHGNDADEDLDTVTSGISEKRLNSDKSGREEEKDADQERTSRLYHVLDVICG